MRRHHRPSHRKPEYQRRKYDATRSILLSDVVRPWVFEDLFRRHVPFHFTEPGGDNPREGFERLGERERRILAERRVSAPRREPPPLSQEDLSRYEGATYDLVRDQVICKQRKERREVMFASRRAGHGKRVSPVRRFTDNSKIHCD